MADALIVQCRRRFPSGFEVDADLHIPLAQAAVTVLFGPSGAGKTSLLRMIAGLERPESGRLSFRGRDWFDSASGLHVPPQERRAGYLFQDYALFPHLTVAGNIAYAAKAGKGRELLKTFGLADLAGRMPRAISGGQQQRVALARALAAEPGLLLLDEPLSALDGPTRKWMRYELRRMLLTGGVPAIIVTHDHAEAMALGDWMAVMIQGRVRQFGAVQEVFRHPADREIAECLGLENVLPAEIVGRAGGLLVLRVGDAQLECIDSGESGPVLARIRPEDVTLTVNPPQASSARNRLTGKVCQIVPEGALARVELDCGFPLASVITAKSAEELRLAPGNMVWATVKATSVTLTVIDGRR